MTYNQMTSLAIFIYFIGMPVAVYLAGRFKVDEVVGVVFFWPGVLAFWIAVGLLYYLVQLMIFIYNLGKTPKKSKARAKPQEVK